MRSLTIVGLMCVLSLVACSKQKEAAVSAATVDPATAPAGHIEMRVSSNADEGVSFNEIRAMRYVKEIVAFGPRPIGSASHKKVEDYIHSQLKGDQVED